MGNINDTSLYPEVIPVDADLVLGTDVSDTSLSADGKTVNFSVGQLSGGIKYLGREDASTSSTLEFDDTYFDNSVYEFYEFRFINILCSTNVIIRARFSDDGGTTFDSGGSDYDYDSTTNQDSLQITTAAGVETGPYTGNVTLYNPGEAGNQTQLISQLYVIDEPGLVTGTGKRNANQITDGIQFFPSTGTFTSGSILMYGYKAG